MDGSFLPLTRGRVHIGAFSEVASHWVSEGGQKRKVMGLVFVGLLGIPVEGLTQKGLDTIPV